VCDELAFATTRYERCHFRSHAARTLSKNPSGNAPPRAQQRMHLHAAREPFQWRPVLEGKPIVALWQRLDASAGTRWACEHSEQRHMSHKRVAIYARVSTAGQTTDNQLQPLRSWADANGHRVVGEYVEDPASGAKGRDRRPRLDAMLKAAERGQLDVVAVVSLDRLGRSLTHLVQIGELLRGLGVDLFVQRQGIDTTTPVGRLMFGMTAAFAEFERELIRERTVAGLARARRQGKHIGRPRLSDHIANRAASLLRVGTSASETARMCGIGLATASRIRKALNEHPAPVP
jgi:DNA invertase Pin-like site-specific DNA recombinase